MTVASECQWEFAFGHPLLDRSRPGINAFGLESHGPNVVEWCRDPGGQAYTQRLPESIDPVSRVDEFLRVLRGGTVGRLEVPTDSVLEGAVFRPALTLP